MPTFKEFREELFEVLAKSAPAGEWIHDFVHSDNPKFAGKSKAKRKQMALAAYYAKQRNEEIEPHKKEAEQIAAYRAEMKKRLRSGKIINKKHLSVMNQDEKAKLINKPKNLWKPTESGHSQKGKIALVGPNPAKGKRKEKHEKAYKQDWTKEYLKNLGGNKRPVKEEIKIDETFSANKNPDSYSYRQKTKDGKVITKVGRTKATPNWSRSKEYHAQKKTNEEAELQELSIPKYREYIKKAGEGKTFRGKGLKTALKLIKKKKIGEEVVLEGNKENKAKKNAFLTDVGRKSIMAIRLRHAQEARKKGDTRMAAYHARGYIDTKNKKSGDSPTPGTRGGLKKVGRSYYNSYREEQFIPEATIQTSNGDHHQVYADLYRQAQTLHNLSLSGYMRNQISKDDHKKVKGHVKLAHGRLESANPKLGSRESIEHLNAAAKHLQDGSSHYHSVSNQGLVATQSNHPYNG